MTRLSRTSPSASGGSFFNEWPSEPHRAVRVSRRETRPERPRRSRRRLAVAVPVLLAGVTSVAVLLPGSPANADPSPNTWYRLRMCESSNNYQINTGNNHYGAYQFDLPTWHSVGGSGYPNLASPAEQDMRALILYRMRGWQPWQCASILGLREDSDARSGRTSDIHLGSSGTSRPSTPSSPSSGFPSRGYFSYGDNSSMIAKWQKELRTRGAPFTGTGQFGPISHAVAWRLQALNGLPRTGRLGPLTYALAWHGRFWPSRPGVHVMPSFPRTASYRYGQQNSLIAQWQREMATRGAPFEGTGQFGPKTEAAIKRLQSENHLTVDGRLGYRTFRSAWMGAYR